MRIQLVYATTCVFQILVEEHCVLASIEFQHKLKMLLSELSHTSAVFSYSRSGVVPYYDNYCDIDWLLR